MGDICSDFYRAGYKLPENPHDTSSDVTLSRRIEIIDEIIEEIERSRRDADEEYKRCGVMIDTLVEVKKQLHRLRDLGK